MKESSRRLGVERVTSAEDVLTKVRLIRITTSDGCSDVFTNATLYLAAGLPNIGIDGQSLQHILYTPLFSSGKRAF